MNTPHNWVVLKITNKETNEVLYKVLAGWYGGYLKGDSWKLNSGIVKCVKYKNTLMFHGHSGSVYSCDLDRERMSNMTSSIYRRISNMNNVSVEILTNVDDWENFKWT